MKRSEMMVKIFNTIYEVDKDLDVHPDFYLVAAEAVLNTIEKSGMLPPEIGAPGYSEWEAE